jgi:predicted phosphoribosyltransferase
MGWRSGMHHVLTATEAQTVADAARITPPAIVSALAVGGVDLAAWVPVVTLVYLGVVIVHRLAHWRSPPGGRRRD